MPAFRYESSLLTWLWSISTNEALTLIRKRERQNSGYRLTILDGIFAHSTEGSSCFDGDEASVKLQNAILKLPGKQRVVFNMKYFDDMSYEEMSGVTGHLRGSAEGIIPPCGKKIEQYLTGLIKPLPSLNIKEMS
ncbi:MAG: RNA polymerase sigma factor [Marinilabiliales bacterium]|nr:RNA polymerase sigma factor [Marinilabiliales bacterium]